MTTHICANIRDAIGMDHDNCLTLLLNVSNRNINDIDDIGLTLLHWASFNGSIKCINVLVDQGANVNIKDIHGRIPLHEAMSKDNKDAVMTLLDRGAIYCAQNANYDPLDYATDEIKAIIHCYFSDEVKEAID